MGYSINNLDGDLKLPEQGSWLGKDVEVCFDYDTSHIFTGVIIRQDVELPGKLLIELDDGRVVRSTVCSYRFPNPKP